MRKFTIAILAGTGLALSACAGQQQVNRSLDSVRQPVVERSQYAIDLNLAGSSGLAANEDGRLNQWMTALQVGYGDRVAVDFGRGYASPQAREQVAKIAGRRGLILADYAPITAEPFIPGTVRVVVSRSQAYVPGCPTWNMNSQSDFSNATSANYGCAVNSNLAAMIADPEDLLSGSEGDPSTRTGVEAIRQYRQAGPRYGEGDLTSGLSTGGSGGASASGGGE